MIVVAGSLNMDLVGRVPRLPAWGETVMGERFACHAGGKGGNQAVAAARQGVPVAFAGAVGDDAFGATLLRGLQDEGVDTGAVQVVQASTGCALIHVDRQGNNAISVLPGANAGAPGPPPHWPSDWRLLVLQLEIPLSVVSAWADAARAAGATVLLNAAPMQPLPPGLLHRLDVLVVNEGELQALVGPQPSIGAALQAAARKGPRRVVVTLGAQGCMACDEGPHVLRRPGLPVAVVDSTGAGDTFVGVLAAALWRQRSFDDALDRANAAAAISCTRAGARGGMPTAAEVEACLACAQAEPMNHPGPPCAA